MFDTQARNRAKPTIPSRVRGEHDLAIPPRGRQKRSRKPGKDREREQACSCLAKGSGHHHSTWSAMNEERHLLHSAYAQKDVGAKQDTPWTYAAKIENTKVDAQQNSGCDEGEQTELSPFNGPVSIGFAAWQCASLGVWLH